MPVPYTYASPLTEADVAEFHSEDLAELVVELDGRLYCDEDLYHCTDCGARSLDRFEDDQCDACTQEAREEAEYLRQLRSDYYAGLL